MTMKARLQPGAGTTARLIMLWTWASCTRDEASALRPDLTKA
jgi:hypothetical protein